MVAIATGVPIVGQGTRIKKGSTYLANLKSIAGLDLSASTIETTNLESLNNYKTYVQGLRDAGDLTLGGNFNPTDHAGFLTDFEDGSVDAYTIEFSDGVTTKTGWTFNAVVTAYKTTPQLGGLVEFECKMKVSGKPTLVIGT